MSRLGSLLLVLAATLAIAAPLRAAPADFPAPFDAEDDLLGRYWTWLKLKLGAPEDFPLPPITVEPLPVNVRMAFVFPTEGAPWQELRIALSPRAVDRFAGDERLVVVGELAHELVHYAMVLQENRWNLRAPVMVNHVPHHCDPGYMDLTRRMGGFIWDVYHSPDAVRGVEMMVRRACWREGNGLPLSARGTIAVEGPSDG